MKTLVVVKPAAQSPTVNRTTPSGSRRAAPPASVGGPKSPLTSDLEPGRYIAILTGHVWRLIYDLGVLMIVYLTALALGIVIDQSGEVARHYQMRGTLFPVENGQTQYPVLFPER